MLLIDKKTKQIEHCSAENITSDVLASTEPLILKGLVADWPLTKLGRESAHKASEYLLQFYNNKPVNVALGDPSTKGRIFYSSDFTGFNYQSLRVSMKILLDKLEQHSSDSSPPTIYMASTMVDHWLPEFRNENDLLLAPINPLASIWIGNKTRIAAHYDLPDNIACSAVGRRRFTLFPPEQMDNLYPGPIDLAPGGQSISLVDFHEPNFEKYPKFHQAIQAAQVAELEPGDAIFIPSMWWHQVEAIGDLNTLINYWFRDPAGAEHHGPPLAALQHAMLAFKDLEPNQKKTWQALLDYYVFNQDPAQFDHIPKAARGILNPIDQSLGQTIRSTIRRLLR